MKNLTLVFFFVLAKGLVACSCARNDSVDMKSELRHNQYIIKGIIESVETFTYDSKDTINGYPSMQLWQWRVYKVKVVSYFKASNLIVPKYIYVTTGMGGGDCGYGFGLGQEYIIYGNKDNYGGKRKDQEFISTTICHRTTQLEEEETHLLKQFAEEKFISN